MKLVTKVALRYLAPRTGERFISFVSTFCLIGTAIGVASLIVVMSIMNGFHAELRKCIVGTSGHVALSVQNPHKVLEEIRKYPFVTDAALLIEGQALLQYQGRGVGVMVRGLDKKGLKIKSQVSKNLRADMEEFGNPNSIILGESMATNLGVPPGATVNLMISKTLNTIMGQIPRNKDFKVIGTTSSGMTDYDAYTVFVPIETATKLFGPDLIIEVYTKDPDKVFEYTSIIRGDFAEEIYQISNWQTTNQSILRTLRIEKTAMSMVLGLIVLVASFNIVSSLFMLVKDKYKDIAILKTIGASKKSIMCVFMLNGSLIGIIGTSIGVTLGILVSSNVDIIKGKIEALTGTQLFDPTVYFLYNLPCDLRYDDVILISAISIGLSLLATIYPSYKAASLNPVEIIRNG